MDQRPGIPANSDKIYNIRIIHNIHDIQNIHNVYNIFLCAYIQGRQPTTHVIQWSVDQRPGIHADTNNIHNAKKAMVIAETS